MFLFEVTDAFEQSKLQYAIVGGFALALHGIVRATMDVDLVINLKLKDFERAEKLLTDLGLHSRLPVRANEVFKMRREYVENRNLIAWAFVDYQNPSRQVDIIITEDRATLKTRKVRVGHRTISVADLDALAKTKKVAGRPKDLIDLESIRTKLNAKNKGKAKSATREISPEEAVRFLEDIRLMVADIDEPTVAISLRIPKNILRATKLKAKADGKKYQSLIVQFVRIGLRSNSK